MAKWLTLMTLSQLGLSWACILDMVIGPHPAQVIDKWVLGLDTICVYTYRSKDMVLMFRVMRWSNMIVKLTLLEHTNDNHIHIFIFLFSFIFIVRGLLKPFIFAPEHCIYGFIIKDSNHI